MWGGVHMWWSEENLWESLLSFYHVEIKFRWSGLVAKDLFVFEPSCWPNVLVCKESEIQHTQNCLHFT